MLVWLLHEEIKVNLILTTQKLCLCFGRFQAMNSDQYYHLPRGGVYSVVYIKPVLPYTKRGSVQCSLY